MSLGGGIRTAMERDRQSEKKSSDSREVLVQLSSWLQNTGLGAEESQAMVALLADFYNTQLYEHLTPGGAVGITAAETSPPGRRLIWLQVLWPTKLDPMATEDSEMLIQLDSAFSDQVTKYLPEDPSVFLGYRRAFRSDDLDVDAVLSEGASRRIGEYTEIKYLGALKEFVSLEDIRRAA